MTPLTDIRSGHFHLFALHSSNGYRALALDESNHRSDCVLEQGGDAHMHVIWHQMTFNDLAFFLPGQFVKDRAKLPAYFPIKRLAAIFGDENNMIFAIPLRVGQAFGKYCPFCSPSGVPHQATE